MGQRISARLQECRDVFSTRIKQGHAALGFVVPYVSDVNVIASFLDAGNRKGQRITLFRSLSTARSTVRRHRLPCS